MLTGLNQKGEWSGIDIWQLSIVDVEPPAKRRNLTHSGIQAERGKSVLFPFSGRDVAKQINDNAGKGERKKRMPFCNETDTN